MVTKGTNEMRGPTHTHPHVCIGRHIEQMYAGIYCVSDHVHTLNRANSTTLESGSKASDGTQGSISKM